MKKSLLCFLAWIPLFSSYLFLIYKFENLYVRFSVFAIYLISFILLTRYIYRDKRYYWFASYAMDDGFICNVFFQTRDKYFNIDELSNSLSKFKGLNKKPIILHYKRVSKKEFQINNQ